MDPAPPPTEDPAPVEEKKESAIEEAARKKLGLRRWDRPALYRETADAATDTDLPFWSVLLLSGAIATLGLALNATAVVIGAMLVAPLLGPLLGLALALAVGDGRLAVQTALTILLGALGIIALASLLTVLLPFQEATSEILSRTRPTTLDLGIAVFSGLAGAVVTVSRENRLSASIPGVAIAVALIPPLGVAGFGVGIGWDWPIIRGSLLLFGANLGGIVLSGMGAFILVGMHRPDVVETARRWHREANLPGLAGSISQTRAFARLRVFDSTWARVGLVMAFVAAVAFPLTSSLRQVIRETRVDQAVSIAIGEIQDGEEAAVLARDVVLGDGETSVLFRVATSAWIGEAERLSVERAASAAAREPVSIVLEQLLASQGNLEAVADRVRSTVTVSEPRSPEAIFDQLQGRISDALQGLALPDDVRSLGAEVVVGGGPVRVRVAYAAPRPLPPEAEAMMARQTAARLGLPPDAVVAEPVPTGRRALPADSTEAAALARLLGRFSNLRLVVVADSAAVDSVRQSIVRAGAPRGQVSTRAGTPARALLSVEE